MTARSTSSIFKATSRRTDGGARGQLATRRTPLSPRSRSPFPPPPPPPSTSTLPPPRPPPPPAPSERREDRACRGRAAQAAPAAPAPRTATRAPPSHVPEMTGRGGVATPGFGVALTNSMVESGLDRRASAAARGAARRPGAARRAPRGRRASSATDRSCSAADPRPSGMPRCESAQPRAGRVRRDLDHHHLVDRVHPRRVVADVRIPVDGVDEAAAGHHVREHAAVAHSRVAFLSRRRSSPRRRRRRARRRARGRPSPAPPTPTPRGPSGR